MTDLDKGGFESHNIVINTRQHVSVVSWCKKVWVFI